MGMLKVSCGVFMVLMDIIKKGYLFLCLILPLSLAASEKVILEVVSPSESINKQYTLKQLQLLPMHEIHTNLPWANESHTYSGPYLEDVLKDAKIKNQWLKLDALDNYHVSFNYLTIRKFKPILALQRDGKPLTIRTKGPIWLILPIDDYSELQSALYNDYMVWHLVVINAQNEAYK